MKNVALVFVCILVPFFATAQEKEPQKVKEVGIVFHNLDNFGFTYKTGTEKSLWRFSTLSLNGTNTKSTDDFPGLKQNTFGIGFSAGREYRKMIIDDLYFRYGLDLVFTYSSQKIDNSTFNYKETDKNYSPGMNIVLGLNYNINEKIVLGAELLPYFTYTRSSNKKVDNNVETKSGYNKTSYGVSNQSVLLTLAYRF